MSIRQNIQSVCVCLHVFVCLGVKAKESYQTMGQMEPYRTEVNKTTDIKNKA